MRNARFGAFESMADFDWSWPKKVDREAVDELFTLAFLKTGHNGVLAWVSRPPGRWRGYRLL